MFEHPDFIPYDEWVKLRGTWEKCVDCGVITGGVRYCDECYRVRYDAVVGPVTSRMRDDMGNPLKMANKPKWLMNCNPHNWVDPARERCPKCSQTHLIPGYCQALDPRNAAKYGVDTQPRSVDTFIENVDTSVDKKEASVDTMDRKERRRAKKAEYERKRRASQKDVS